MRTYIVLLLFIIGCSHQKEPTPKDTLFLDKNRDWEHLYAQELKAAIKHEDDAAFVFLARIFKSFKRKQQDCNYSCN